MSRLAVQYIEYTVSSTCVNLSWNVVGATDQKYSFRTKTVGGLKGDMKVDRFPQMQTKTILRLEPGHWYTVTLEIVCRHKAVASAEVRFKSILSQMEIAALQARAMTFICKEVFGNDLQEISIFYRSKPPPYWQSIQLADGIMRPYIKDSTGHPGSAINGEINGLFFSGRLMHGALPVASPYGAQRFQIPCQKLYLPERHHLYFADFYCNVNRHYVTLVVCEVDSDADKYCCDKLIPLDPFNNMFLQVAVHNSYDYKYFLNNNIWVEILYTADVRLWWGKFDYVFPLGESDPAGIPNNKTCLICNLYPPQQRSDTETV